MAGMFDRLMGGRGDQPAAEEKDGMLISLWAKKFGVPPEKIKAVIAKLRAQGVPINKVTVGEELSMPE